ncbi:hypothetical protein FRC12_003251 [Ceratobasidium sp. 428]|nr:hypothetical protein FRC12_003251 [Ceratobasidium sp. 428]
MAMASHFVSCPIKNPRYSDAQSRLVNRRDPTPAYIIRVEDKILVSGSSKLELGPGQRYFIASAEWILMLALWFVKDIWRDITQQSSKNYLCEKPHNDECLPGLMTINYHGYILDADGQNIKPTVLAPQDAKTAAVWEKTCIAPRGVDKPLYDARTLREFLCAMYDACVVESVSQII